MSDTRIENEVKTIEVTQQELNMLNIVRNYLGTKPLPFDETANGNLFLDRFIKKINES